MSKIRVLHCPDIVGGNPQSLARMERELGLASWAVSFRQTLFSYQFDEILLKPLDGPGAYAFSTLGLFLKGVFFYDLIHYNFGRTIFPSQIVKRPKNNFLWWIAENLAKVFQMTDLPVFYWLGKGIAVTFQGDDARQGDYSLEHFEISIANKIESGYYTAESDAEKRKVIEKFDRFADLIYYLNPDLGHVLPGRARFVPYAHVDLRDWKFVDSYPKPRPLIVHAPSHRGVKGTEVILRTIERLQIEGMDFDFKLVEGISNKDARKIYEQADLLIDQLYAGWYGGLALELMALGKPVISYIRESDLIFIPEKMRHELPVINADAESLFEVLMFWLKDKEALIETGRRSRRYVENWHDPLVIAAQMKKDYQGVLLKKNFYNLIRKIRFLFEA
ncbi:MAG: glycosyltransferase [Anaerolineales bacterium]|nr:glycosyltransferase [Anaerolineales bacterium]